MNGRTIATHGGGDLAIGGGPPIDGVLHAWFYPEGQRGAKGAYGIMLAHGEAEKLQEALRERRGATVATFVGSLKVTGTKDLVCLWFYAYGESTPQQACRLYEGAIDATVEAIGEVLNPIAPMPADLHDAALSGAELDRLSSVMASGCAWRKAA